MSAVADADAITGTGYAERSKESGTAGRERLRSAGTADTAEGRI
jgi:hypothetical protein